MIAPGEGYRLLEVGEAIVASDEAYDDWSEKWVPVTDRVIGNERISNNWPMRRKLPAPQPSGWVSVKERLPSEPGRVLAINHFDGKAHCTTWNGVSFTLNPKPYAWMAIPKPPAPPKSEAEIAWEKFVSEQGGEYLTPSCKAAFIAGFNAEAAK